jgi:CRP-like cAMP-binding protein
MRDPFPRLMHLGDGSQFVDHFASIIDRIRLFEDFEYVEVRRLASRMACYRAPAGSLLIGEGDEGDFCLLLLRGSIGVFKHDAGGHDVRIGEAAPGEILGEMSMIDGHTRVASCIADTEVDFGVIDREGVTAIIVDDPRLGVKVLIELVQHLSGKLRTASRKLAELLTV